MRNVVCLMHIRKPGNTSSTSHSTRTGKEIETGKGASASFAVKLAAFFGTGIFLTTGQNGNNTPVVYSGVAGNAEPGTGVDPDVYGRGERS